MDSAPNDDENALGAMHSVIGITGADAAIGFAEGIAAINFP